MATGRWSVRLVSRTNQIQDFLKSSSLSVSGSISAKRTLKRTLKRTMWESGYRIPKTQVAKFETLSREPNLETQNLYGFYKDKDIGSYCIGWWLLSGVCVWLLLISLVIWTFPAVEATNQKIQIEHYSVKDQPEEGKVEPIQLFLSQRPQMRKKESRNHIIWTVSKCACFMSRLYLLQW